MSSRKTKAVDITTEYTFDDLKEHTSESDLWLLISGKVYDVTEFLQQHPGGPEVVKDAAGACACGARAGAGGGSHVRVGHLGRARAVWRRHGCDDRVRERLMGPSHPRTHALGGATHSLRRCLAAPRFDDIGHSEDARKQLKPLQIGVIKVWAARARAGQPWHARKCLLVGAAAGRATRACVRRGGAQPGSMPPKKQKGKVGSATTTSSTPVWAYIIPLLILAALLYWNSLQK